MDEYKRKKRVVKRMVREAKKRVIEKWTLGIGENFKENKKKFWKGINEIRKGKSLRLLSIRNSMGEELTNIFFDKLVRQVNGRGMGKVVKLRDENGGG